MILLLRPGLKLPGRPPRHEVILAQRQTYMGVSARDIYIGRNMDMNKLCPLSDMGFAIIRLSNVDPTSHESPD